MEHKRAIIYLRASTNEDKQANSLNIQREVIKAFCERHNYVIEAEFSEYQSGTDDYRPEFQSALSYARDNNCYVIIYRLDRLCRTLTAFSHINDILHMLRFADMGDIQPSLMLIGTMLSVAAQESINTSVRIKATIAHLLKMDPDRTWGNQNLYEEHGHKGLKVRQDNAAKYNSHIKSIVDDLHKAGYASIDQQVARLNEMGFTTRRGQQFNYQNLYRILRRT